MYTAIEKGCSVVSNICVSLLHLMSGTSILPFLHGGINHHTRASNVSCQDSSMVRFWRIDLMVSSSNPRSARFLLQENSHQLSVTPDIGIKRCGDIERKALDTAR